MWLVLGLLEQGIALNALHMADKIAFRGYDVNDYEIAIQAAVELGWAEPDQHSNAFHLTQAGQQLRAQAEQLTNEYFYAPWAVLSETELKELYHLLARLLAELSAYRKSR